MLSALLMLAAALPSDASPPAVYDVREEERISLPQLTRRLSEFDVVFLGEEHTSVAGHRLERKILAGLHRLRPDLALSLEMFERDVQGVLDDYLRGRIDEKTFLEHARPWSNYKKHYRPLVEFARTENLDVLAANVPREIAQTVAAGNEPPGSAGAFMPRSTTAPRDAYWERFEEAMREHEGAEDRRARLRYYRAQCLKDDAMAESIADYLAQHRHRNPLVLHVCGKFHSDFGQGTVQRLLGRRPLIRVAVVSMEVAGGEGPVDIRKHRDRCHFLLLVPEEE